MGQSGDAEAAHDEPVVVVVGGGVEGALAGDDGDGVLACPGDVGAEVGLGAYGLAPLDGVADDCAVGQVDFDEVAGCRRGGGPRRRLRSEGGSRRGRRRRRCRRRPGSRPCRGRPRSRTRRRRSGRWGRPSDRRCRMARIVTGASTPMLGILKRMPLSAAGPCSAEAGPDADGVPGSAPDACTVSAGAGGRGGGQGDGGGGARCRRGVRCEDVAGAFGAAAGRRGARRAARTGRGRRRRSRG